MVCLAEGAIVHVVAVNPKEVIVLLVAVVIAWRYFVTQSVLAHQVNVFLVLSILHVHSVIVRAVSAIVGCRGIQGCVDADDLKVSLTILFLSHVLQLAGSLFVDLGITPKKGLECRVRLSLSLVLLD